MMRNGMVGCCMAMIPLLIDGREGCDGYQGI